MNTLKIVKDDTSSNPREEFDNLCFMNFEHRRYNLGDENIKEVLLDKLGLSYSDLNNRELIQKAKKQGVIFHSMPVYMYEHGNIALSLKPFHCPWDSGQLGEIFVFTDDVKNEFSVKRFGKKIKTDILEKIIKNMVSEIETYSQYLSGDVYGFQIVDEDDNIIDSCYGFYGSDFQENGIKEYIDEEYHSQLEAIEVSYS